MPKDKYSLIDEIVCFQKDIAKTGFDWPSPYPVLDKLSEEIEELKEALEANALDEKISEEYGDILFVALNLANHLNLSPEKVLKLSLEKFQRRFQGMIALAEEQGVEFNDLCLTKQEALWRQVKKEEAQGL